jgi:surface protein with Ig-like domain
MTTSNSGGLTASSPPPQTSSASTTPPVITINGDNPAIVQIGVTYNDLGATITGPQADLNLGIKTLLNDTLTSNIVIDTSAVATDTIDYVVSDSTGLTATSTRTIIISAPVASNTPSTSASSTAASSSPSAQ